MIILPDGAKIEMTWKQVKYINHQNYIIFQVIPMHKGKDIIIIPNKEQWKSVQNIFSFSEREEILFLIEHIKWKRDIKLIDLDVEPMIDKEFAYIEGAIESTQGYKILTKENLFDVNSKLENDQVKDVYCKLEEKYALSCKGNVLIKKELLVEGSVVNELCIPILQGNSNVKIEIV